MVLLQRPAARRQQRVRTQYNVASGAPDKVRQGNRVGAQRGDNIGRCAYHGKVARVQPVSGQCRAQSGETAGERARLLFMQWRMNAGAYRSQPGQAR